MLLFLVLAPLAVGLVALALGGRMAAFLAVAIVLEIAWVTFAVYWVIRAALWLLYRTEAYHHV